MTKVSLSAYSLLLLSLLVAKIALAHEFWIEPASFRPAMGTELSIRLWVGDAFVGLPYRRNPPHIRDFYLVGPTATKPVIGLPGSDPAGTVQIDAAGLQIVGYRSAQTITVLEANRFGAYLKEEEFTQVLRKRALNGQENQPGREAFARYAKSMLLVGGDIGQGYDLALGFELEFIPQVNPYSLRLGDSLPLRILYRGKPLGNARVVAFNAGNPAEQFITYSDADGRLSFTLHRQGVWLFRSVHIKAAPIIHEKADWVSFWASLTFELPFSATPLETSD
ncbi:MAG: hypothetical protein ACI845_000629 [Gammaproteobacteria bacterium]